METVKRNYIALISTSLTVLTLILCAVFAVYGYHQGIFESRNTLVAFISQAGIWGPCIFHFHSGHSGCHSHPAGICHLYRRCHSLCTVPGFLYSYTGMCIGSVLAFYFARRFGTGLVKKMISEKNYNKYILWLEKGNKFDLIFAASIFLPAAPDDVLCFIAGLTRMTWQKFTTIILLGKPFVIALYCLAVAGVIHLPNVM